MFRAIEIMSKTVQSPAREWKIEPSLAGYAFNARARCSKIESEMIGNKQSAWKWKWWKLRGEAYNFLANLQLLLIMKGDRIKKSAILGCLPAWADLLEFELEVIAVVVTCAVSAVC